MSPFRSLLETADLLGRERYVELALFEALGHRSLSVAQPETMLLLARAARVHAWRAKVLEELLPVSLGLPGVDESTRSPGTLFDEALAELCSDGDEAGIIEALARVVYPEMLGAYRAHLVSCSAAADPPVSIALRRVISDLEVQADELYEVLESDGGPLTSRAQSVAARLSDLGGPFGALAQ